MHSNSIKVETFLIARKEYIKLHVQASFLNFLVDPPKSVQK